MAPAPSCSQGQGRKLSKRKVRSLRERESTTSASVFSEEASKELSTEMSRGGGIFGEWERLFDTWRVVSGTSSKQGEEADAVFLGSYEMLMTPSWTNLPLNCSPTDMKWFDNDHVGGL